MTERHMKWKNIPDDKWNDWHWQMRHRLTTPEDLRPFFEDGAETPGIEQCLKYLRMAVTPYYASLIKSKDPHCPVRLQAIPQIDELTYCGTSEEDPLEEEADAHASGLVHRYPDRALLLVTDQCAMYCRHCTRRRFAGKEDKPVSLKKIQNAIKYIEEHPEIRDVIISGGDPLTLSDRRIEYILSSLRRIAHVEVIRIGTRTPVTMPQRITDTLCAIIEKYHPVWINTHFNHPVEFTDEAAAALSKLLSHGVPLGNQTVLLRGVNDCYITQRELVHQLVKHRVRPYYLYQCDLSRGIEHFRTPVAEGIAIIERLRGHTSGMAVPVFVIDAPGGGGKIPVGPQYMIAQSPGMVLLRNYEGITCAYPEPQVKASRCESCSMPCAGVQERGLARILNGEKKCLVPRENIRMQRRVQDDQFTGYHTI